MDTTLLVNAETRKVPTDPYTFLKYLPQIPTGTLVSIFKYMRKFDDFYVLLQNGFETIKSTQSKQIDYPRKINIRYFEINSLDNFNQFK